MKKTILTFIFFILTLTKVWSQDQLWNDRGNIISTYENYPDTNFIYNIFDSTDNILVQVYGFDSLEITHYIRPYHNGSFDNESICDSIVINLLCDSCVQFHINQMSNSKSRKWIELSDSLYISSKWVSKFWPEDKTPNIYTVPFMRISQKKESNQIILYTEELTKKKWKELKKRIVTNIN